MQRSHRVFSSLADISRTYELVVIGGGVVGLSLVSKLAAHPYFERNKILVVERRNIFNNDYAKESLRVYAMTKHSIKFMDLTSKLESEHLLYKNFNGMQIWKDSRPSYLKFDSSNLASQPYGSMVNENYLMGHLLDSLKDRNVDFLVADDLVDIHNNKNCGVDLQFSDNESIKAGLMIASDGANSTVAKKVGVYKYGYSHNQRGLVAHLQTLGHNDFAFQKFFNQEVIGILPMSSDRSSIVWSIGADYYEKLMRLDEAGFIDELNAKVNRHNNVNSNNSAPFIKPPVFTKLLSKRAAFPLNTMWLETYSKGNVAFIGDSAHSIHPMLGQGLNLGINDASILSDLITGQIGRGGNISQTDYLDEYSVKSMAKNQAFHALVEILKTAYFSDNPFIDGFRDVSLDLINRSGALKTIMTRIANSN